MNVPLLIVCIGLGIATYHGVVTILDLFIRDEPRKVSSVRYQASALAKDAAQTKRRMTKAISRYNQLRGIV